MQLPSSAAVRGLVIDFVCLPAKSCAECPQAWPEFTYARYRKAWKRSPRRSIPLNAGKQRSEW